MARKWVQEWALVGTVTLMSIGANLPRHFAENWGIDRRYLLGGLIALVGVSLVRYLKFTLVLVVVILTVGTNLPAEMAEELHINQDILLFALISMVVISLTSRVFNYLPTGLEPKPSERPHGTVALFNAVSRGHVSVAQQLLKAGVNVNARTSTGQTALMAAAAKGYADLVKVLLVGGAEVNAVDSGGKSALRIALDSGYTRAAEILREAGASEV
ncbi:MAG: ankyrin repeat domain-containing protein [Acidiferrobacterales bacterium]